MGISPRIPSIVLRTCKPKPTDHARETFKGLANTRTVSPSVHSRSSSEGSVSFFLASALSYFHQQALRPPGGEDAQCVQPISATQTTCVHPHLVSSQPRTTLSHGELLAES